MRLFERMLAILVGRRGRGDAGRASGNPFRGLAEPVSGRLKFRSGKGAVVGKEAGKEAGKEPWKEAGKGGALGEAAPKGGEEWRLNSGSGRLGMSVSGSPVQRGGRRWWQIWRRGQPAARSPQQLEMLFSSVHPVRNTLDDESGSTERVKSRLIFETKPDAAVTLRRMQEESDRTWVRLRGRRLKQLEVKSE